MPSQAKLIRRDSTAWSPKPRRHSNEREATYRERAAQVISLDLRAMWSRVFGRGACANSRCTTRTTNHDNNPLDGSNWELLCIYCMRTSMHASWMRRQDEGFRGTGIGGHHSPFADLQARLEAKRKK